MNNHAVHPRHIRKAVRNSGRHAIWWRFLRNRLATVGLSFAIFTIAVAAIAPLVAPHDPAATDFVHINEWPSRAHLFGTDASGVDIFSVTLLSLRTSYAIVAISQAITMIAGIGVGLTAGYAGGWLDSILSRSIDVVFSFPSLVIAIFIAGSFGVPMYARYGPAGRLYLSMAALSFLNWAGLARVVRAEVLRTKGQPFVEASIVSGAGRWWIGTRHLLPNVFGISVVIASQDIGAVLTSEAVLSYLGLGVTVPTPSLGRLIQSGQSYIDPFWYQFAFPATVLALMVLAFALIGDGLRDALSPI